MYTCIGYALVDHLYSIVALRRRRFERQQGYCTWKWINSRRSQRCRPVNLYASRVLVVTATPTAMEGTSCSET